jgi:hypothetical protein
MRVDRVCFDSEWSYSRSWFSWGLEKHFFWGSCSRDSGNFNLYVCSGMVCHVTTVKLPKGDRLLKLNSEAPLTHSSAKHSRTHPQLACHMIRMVHLRLYYQIYDNSVGKKKKSFFSVWDGLSNDGPDSRWRRKSILYTCHWMCCVQSFHSFIQNQSCIHVTQLVRKKYKHDSMKTMISGSHRVTVEEAGHLSVCTVLLCILVPPFRINVPHLFSGLWVNSWTHNPDEDEGSKLREAVTQPHCATTQKTSFLNTETGFVMSVRPHGTTRLPLDGLWWNFIFEHFSKICQEDSSFVEIGQK